MDHYHPQFKIKEHQLFPNCTLLDQHGMVINLHEIKSKYIALYFYPQDDTPTCTKQACNIRDSYLELKQKECMVFGISPDNEHSHQRFIKKFNLNFDLLIDINHQLADELGIWGLKFTFGREYEGLHRVTYLLDENRTIKKIIYPVESGRHSEQILEYLTS